MVEMMIVMIRGRNDVQNLSDRKGEGKHRSNNEKSEGVMMCVL